MLYGLLHSVLASRSSKIWAAKSFGRVSMRYYRLIFNAIGLLTLLPILAIPIIIPGQIIYQLSGIALILTSIGQLTAVTVLILALFQTDPWQFLGLRQLIHQPEKGEHRLVVSGLYGCVRHPLYISGLIFIWLIPYMTTTVLALNLSLTIYIYIGSMFEERRLLAEFGSDYRTYRRQVPRLIPHIGHCLSHRS
jgi:protein-S-isoprenylcysteine O-methyltransferase Ste14